MVDVKAAGAGGCMLLTTVLIFVITFVPLWISIEFGDVSKFGAKAWVGLFEACVTTYKDGEPDGDAVCKSNGESEIQDGDTCTGRQRATLKAAIAFYMMSGIIGVISIGLSGLSAVKPSFHIITAAACLIVFVFQLIGFDCAIGMANTRYQCRENGPDTQSIMDGETASYGMCFVIGIINLIFPLVAMVLLCLVRPDEGKNDPVMSDHI